MRPDWLRHAGRRVTSLMAWLVTLVLVVSAVAAPRPAAAQGGYDDVIFWDDAGESSSTADVPAPADLVAEGYDNVVYLNPSGGRTPDSDLLVIVALEGVQVIRDRDWQIYDSSIDGGTMAFTLFAAGNCIDEARACYSNSDEARGPLTDNDGWDTNTTELLQDGPTTWQAQTIQAVEIAPQYSGGSITVPTTFTLTTIYTYTPPSPFVQIEATVTSSPVYTGEMQLYLTADMYLDGSDNGPGAAVTYRGNQIVVQTNETGVGGIAATGRPFDSYFEGYYQCLYSDYSLPDCGDSAEHWSVDENTSAAWFGMGFGTPFPMPAIVNGRAEDEVPEELDAGVGAHWDLTTNRTVRTALYFSSLSAFQNLSDEEEPTPGGEAGAEPAQYCTQPATLEIKPDPIEIQPGGAATVWVELRNPCRDRPTAPADALLSLSDGLQVIETSDGVLNLGQRAALQRFSLGAGEMLGWYAVVRASDPFVTAPLAIAELYSGAGVVGSNSLNFTVPTPAEAPAPVEAPIIPAEPVAVEAPAPLPAALPNTSNGAELPVVLVLLVGTVAAFVGFGLRRRRV